MVITQQKIKDIIPRQEHDEDNGFPAGAYNSVDQNERG